MANSDNVVRAGLTPKFKDIATLTEMLETDSSGSTVDLYEKDDRIIYKTSAEEFEIELLKLNKPFYIGDNSDINILLLLEGKITISWNNKIEEFTRGDAVLLPACLGEYTIFQNSPSYLFNVRVP
jgi:mannose-6-phosphate isomerase